MDIARQSLAITIVFALLWTALWLIRKKGGIRIRQRKGRGECRMLESRGKLVLSQQHTIHLVRVGQRELVLAMHPSGVTLLAELPVITGGET
ncbi:MAG TPA: flagellar biosynthetic protein FliO [Bryobacteraceae bacterium]|jgi:flagellar biogenesis protein FliO|nr:flagellar biosynthetic protein FliO [Bryobacteraceae bacterium]